MSQPVLKIEIWPIDKITPYEDNAKIHNKAQVEGIAQALAEFGWDQPIVVDKDGVIIKGHGRRLAAIKNGWKEVPVYQRTDLSPEQVRAARLADNRVAVGDVDPEILRRELASLEFDMHGIFDDKELEFLAADLALPSSEMFVEDVSAEVRAGEVNTAPRVPEKPIAIAKALGFKTVSSSKERALALFMARIEADTNKKGAEAFVAFVEELLA